MILEANFSVKFSRSITQTWRKRWYFMFRLLLNSLVYESVGYKYITCLCVQETWLRIINSMFNTKFDICLCKSVDIFREIWAKSKSEPSGCGWCVVRHQIWFKCLKSLVITLLNLVLFSIQHVHLRNSTSGRKGENFPGIFQAGSWTTFIIIEIPRVFQEFLSTADLHYINISYERLRLAKQSQKIVPQHV